MRQASTTKRTTTKTTTRTLKNRIENPLSQTTYSNENFRQEVERVAYQLYVLRGCVHGHDVEDWLAAEQIVRGA